MDAIQTFRKYIKEKGLRNTPEREVIIEEISAIRGHFDVDDLFLRLRNKDKRASKASLYRTIPLLIDCGLIKEVYFENGHLHYEGILGHRHHCHLRCIACGKIIEFADDAIENIQNRIGRQHGFALTDHRFEITGYCPACAKDRAVSKDNGTGSISTNKGGGNE